MSNWNRHGRYHGGFPASVRRQAERELPDHCAHCHQSDHWSYNHGSEHEQCDDNGRLFSPDHADYSARCVSCHKVYDLSR